MAAVANLSVSLTARTKKFDRSMRQSQKRVKAFKGSLVKFGAVAIGAAVAGLTAVVKSSLASVDALAKMSVRLDISTETLSRFQHVANLSGVSFETMAKAIQVSQKALGEAELGLKSYTDAFDTLGIDIVEFKKLSPEEQFITLGAAIQKLPSQALKTAISMRLMGRGGVELATVFAGGAESVRGMISEIDNLGGALSGEDAAKVEQANNAMTKLGTAFTVAGRELAILLAGDLQRFAEFMTANLVPAVQQGVTMIRLMINDVRTLASLLGSIATLDLRGAVGALAKGSNRQIILQNSLATRKGLAGASKEEKVILQRMLKIQEEQLRALDRVSDAIGDQVAVAG